MNEPEKRSMTCEEFAAGFEAYRAGTLSDADAVAMETHAAECVGCEARMEEATRVSVQTFAPPLPPELRAATLATLAAVAAVRAAAQPPGNARRLPRWVGPLLGLAAAAALVITVLPRPTRAPIAVTPIAVVDSAVRDAPDLADQWSRPEFTALDAAAQEIERELTRTPNDPDLRAFLASVQARRDELARRVKDASS